MLLLLASLWLTAAPLAPGESVRLNPAQGELAELLAKQATRGHAAGLDVLVQLDASWCEPCKTLKRLEADPRVKAAYAGTLRVQIDIDDFAYEAFQRCGLDSRQIPRFVMLDAKGRPKARPLDPVRWHRLTAQRYARELLAYLQRK